MNIFRQLGMGDIIYSPDPFPTEEKLERYLMLYEQLLALDGGDFSTPFVIDNQIVVPGAKVNGQDGRLDLLIDFGNSTLAIAELKNVTVGEDQQGQCEAINQLHQYLKNRHNLPLRSLDNLQEDDPMKYRWVGIIVAPDFEPEVEDKLRKGAYNLTVGNVTIPVGGIKIQRFKDKATHQVIVLTNAYFALPKTSAFQKFSYNGKTDLGNRDLVWEIVQDYLKRNPTATSQDFDKDFPDNIMKRTQAPYYSQPNNQLRSFLDPIQLADGEFYISNQWGRGGNRSVDKVLPAIVQDLYQQKKLSDTIH